MTQEQQNPNVSLDMKVTVEVTFVCVIMPPFKEGGAYCVAHVGRYVGIP